MSIDMSPAAVSARLRRVAELSDLRSDRRLREKIDYSPEAIDRRLRKVSALRRLCLTLASPPAAPAPPGSRTA